MRPREIAYVWCMGFAALALFGSFDLPAPPDSLEIIEAAAPFRIEPGMPVYLSAEPDAFVNARLADIAVAASAALRPEVVAQAAGPGIYAGVIGAFGPFEGRELRRALSSAGTPGPGGYLIVVGPDFAIIAGADEAGLRHGWRTFTVLVEQSPVLPQMRLLDTPATSFRALKLGSVDSDALEGAVAGRADAVLAPAFADDIARYGFATSLPETLAAPRPAPGQIMVKAPAAVEPVTVEARSADVFSRIERHARENAAVPLIIDGTGADAARIAEVLLHAWNPERPLPVWPAGLNGLLAANLEDPDPSAVIDAVFAHVNRTPHLPLESVRAFENELKRLEPAVPGDHPDAQLVRSVYRLLADYLALDAEFKAAPGPAPLNKLLDVVAAYGAVDLEAGGERAQRIAQVIQTQNVFVPPSVLFGRILFPRSPMTPPSPTAQLLPYAGEPAYDYGERRADAIFDFGVPLAAIARIDFEAAGISDLSVSAGTADDDLRGVGALTLAPGVVTGPIALSAPVTASRLRVSASGGGERSTLRSAIALAWKDAAPIRLAAVNREPAVDRGAIDGLPIAASGFVLTGQRSLAAAQSVLRGGFARDALILAVEAYEPRITTMESYRGPADGPIADREAVEVHLATSSGRYVFGLNPAGVRFDTRDGDAEWDGTWEGGVRTESDRWFAVFRIPLTGIGGAGAGLSMNAVRYRYNVQKETSALVMDAAGRGAPDAAWAVGLR